MPDLIPQRTYDAIDRLLASESGQTLINNVLNDFTPQSNAPQKGFFARLISPAWYALRHPRDAYALYKLQQSGEYTSEEFQSKLLENPKVWDFVDSLGPKIPQLGKIIASRFMADTPTYGPAPKPASTKPLMSPSTRQKLQNHPRLHIFLDKNAESITTTVGELSDKYPIKGYMEAYGADKRALELLPSVLRHPQETNQILEALGDPATFMKTLETFFDIVKDSKEFEDYVRKYPDLLPRITDKYLNINQEWTEWANTFGLNSGVLPAITPLLYDMKEAHKLIKAYNNGDYNALSEVIIDGISKSQDGHPLLASLQALAKDGTFARLMSDILILNPGLKASVIDAYGITDTQIPQVMQIVEILLDAPDSLQRIFKLSQEGKYAEMSAEILQISGSDTPTGKALKAYLESNADLMTQIVQRAIPVRVSTPSNDSIATEAAYLSGSQTQNASGINKVQQYVSAETITKHTPTVIQTLVSAMTKPSPLVIEGLKTNNYMQLSEGIVDMLCDKKTGLSATFSTLAKDGVFTELMNGILSQNPQIKEQLTSLGITDQDIPKFAKLISILSEKPEYLKSVFQHFKDGNYLGITKELLTILSNEQKAGNDAANTLSGWMRDNNDLMSTIVTHTLDNNPEVKYWTSGSDTKALADRVLNALVDNPESLLRITNDIADGNWKKLPQDFIALGMGMITEVVKTAAKSVSKWGGWIGATVGAATWCFCGSSEQKQKQEYVDKALEKLMPNQELTSQGTKFDGVQIRGDIHHAHIKDVTFVNSDCNYASFEGSKFSNCSFLGARLQAVSFSGAEIDSVTLQSLIDARTNGGQPVVLDGAKLVGDLSGLDLSKVSLERVDYSQVTAAKDTKFPEGVQPAMPVVSAPVSTPKTTKTAAHKQSFDNQPPTQPSSPLSPSVMDLANSIAFDAKTHIVSSSAKVKPSAPQVQSVVVKTQ